MRPQPVKAELSRRKALTASGGWSIRLPLRLATLNVHYRTKGELPLDGDWVANLQIAFCLFDAIAATRGHKARLIHRLEFSGSNFHEVVRPRCCHVKLPCGHLEIDS